MMELGFRAERSRNVAYDKLRSVADKSLANNLINIIDDVRYEKGNYSQSDLYVAKRF